MAERIRWGILSTAQIGRKLIKGINLGSSSCVQAVASREYTRALEFAKECGIPRAFGSYEELLNCGEIDAIYNPLPNSMHAEWTIKALEAGIPVLCEKPFASNAAEAQEMVNASKRTGVLLGEAFMYRFHPIYDQVLDRIANGAIGDLVSISSTFKFNLTDRTNIRAIGELAGGALMDVGCYCVNLSRRIVGTQPMRVHAFERRTTVDDTLFGTLEFANGVVAQIECSIESRSARGAEIAGTEGLIVLDSPWFPGDDSAKFTVYSGDKQEVVQTAGANSYQLEVDDFTAALRTRRPLRWGPEDAVENMVVVDALYKSARQQTVVAL